METSDVVSGSMMTTFQRIAELRCLFCSRSPGHRVPWWVLIWIKRSPLVFLVLSVACFSVGLVLFAYSSSQARVRSSLIGSRSHRDSGSLGLYNHHGLHRFQ